MQEKIDALLSYYATNGSMSDAFALTQALAAQAWGEIAKLAHIILGVV